MKTCSTIEKISRNLRHRIIDKDAGRLLIASLSGSEQEKDLSAPLNCDGFGRIRHFRRKSTSGSSSWPPDPLPMDPVCKAFGLERVDIIRAQVFQIAACNFSCWYCFVPYDLISADLKHSGWLSPGTLVDRYLDQPDPPLVIDLSGGQPDLAPEWVLLMMQALKDRGLDDSVYLWSDDNLSTDFFWRFLSESDRDLIQSYRNYSRVCCFKGYSPQSFSFNTRRDEDLYRCQFDMMRRLLTLKLDLYAYTTFTTHSCTDLRDEMKRFVDALQSLDENLPLRTVPLEIIDFTPVKSRLTDETRLALKNQHIVIEYWNKELEDRFPAEQRNQNIADVPLSGRK
ncbi:MAG: hypothetical protein RBR35_00605 [Salinivirgaceae bacterium]|nr:hypothetical protein [Salinivirgaceae bacterium]